MKNWTGERLETFVNTRDAIEHLHRYAIVSKYIKDKIVLDIASGEGYGSSLMSEKASFVYGVDIDTDTVQKAKLKYKRTNLKFLTGNTSQIPIEDNSIDVVVSFETIEHHDEHDEMMIEIKRVLRPNGILIISTPDKLYYSDERNYNNQYHIKELYKNDFVLLLAKYFSKRQVLFQKYSNGNSVIVSEENKNDLNFFLGDYSKVNEIEIDALYIISIASDFLFEEQNTSVFDGSQLINNFIDIKLKNLYNSNTYKVGTILLAPFKLLKKILKS